MTMKSETKDKVALVGTPCHMTAAAKIDTFSDYLVNHPGYKDRSFLHGKFFLLLT